MTPAWIKTETVKRGYSLSELAEKAGIDCVRLVNILNGAETPGADFDKRIQAAFDAWDAETKRPNETRAGTPSSWPGAVK